MTDPYMERVCGYRAKFWNDRFNYESAAEMVRYAMNHNREALDQFDTYPATTD